MKGGVGAVFINIMSSIFMAKELEELADEADKEELLFLFRSKQESQVESTKKERDVSQQEISLDLTPFTRPIFLY